MGVEREGKAKLQATEMSVLGKVAGVTWLDCIRNDEIRQILQQRSIVEVVCTYVCHIYACTCH